MASALRITAALRTPRSDDDVDGGGDDEDEDVDDDDEEDEDDDDDDNSNTTVKQEEDYVPYPIRYCTRRTHKEATVTAAEVKREEKEEESVVLPFVSTRQYIYFIAPDIQY